MLELRVTLRCLSIPLRKISYMFGGNHRVFNSIVSPNGKSHKSHVALSFHRVREAIVSKIIIFYHFINEKIDTEDVLSKHWVRLSA